MLFREILRESNYLILLISFSLLTASVLIESLFEQNLLWFGHWNVFLEDGLKWIGICFCFAYYSITCFSYLSKLKLNTALITRP